MKKLFWDCFRDTGKIDMYLLYKDFENTIDFDDSDVDTNGQSSLEETQQGGTFQEG